MKIIREGVFETNSSSSHSIVIKKRTVIKADNIPLNEACFEVSQAGDCSYSEEQVDIDRYYSQVGKLSFTLNMLAAVCEHLWNHDKMFADYSYEGYREAPSKFHYMTPFWEEMIHSVYFTALQEAVQEVTGTHIEFVRPDTNDVPFFDVIYTEDESVEELLGIDEDNFDVEKYKQTLKDIIFDDDIVVVNANVPYGMEGDWDV